MNNRIENIRALLDLYYKGETTPEQEQTLSKLLQNASELPPELESDRRLFSALEQQIENAKAPEFIEKNLMAAIKATRQPSFRLKRRRLVYMIAGAAAALAIVLTVGLGITQGGSDKSSSSVDSHIACNTQNNPMQPQTSSGISEVYSPSATNPAPSEADETVGRIENNNPEMTASKSQHNAQDTAITPSLTPEEEGTIIKGLQMLDKAGQQLAQAKATALSGLETTEATFQKFN